MAMMGVSDASRARKSAAQEEGDPPQDTWSSLSEEDKIEFKDIEEEQDEDDPNREARVNAGSEVLQQGFYFTKE